MAIAVGAAIVGDTVGFEVGKHLGPRILELKALSGHRRKVHRAQDFLARRGGSAVFLGRWTAFFRAVMPALAGMSRMHYPTFLAWNATGGVAWGATVVTAGFFAGESYARVEKWLGGGAAAVVASVALLALVVWRIRSKREDAGRERGGSGDAVVEPE
jgi:membrane protein DedA with SNARE-associated domain